MKYLPRIQAKKGIIEHPPELKGKWTFEVFLSFIGSGEEPDRIFHGVICETEEEAEAGMRKACDIAVRSLQDGIYGGSDGKFIDLKTNQVRSFEDT